MISVSSNLYVGTEMDCFFENRDKWAVIHACKSPCHQAAVGYRGSLPRNHPNYLVFKQENHLFLNMVDMDMPLMHEFTGPIITAALNFIESNNSSKDVLIHCNLGQSRSPALALLFLAKRANSIKNESYEVAKEEFLKLYPGYNPGNGIESYLIKHWNDLE